ncbi:unnamed protein product [Caenorhabditis sp. 36 PRJEB53466]|nr:unnamed protein product [Caenorhabditis sp. 36 PRJEB53466]
MGFNQDVAFLSNLPISDKVMISSGPIIVYKTPACKLDTFADRFEIIHGWSPLLLSTAQCFTRLVLSQMEEPVCAPIIWKLVISYGDVKIFTNSQTMPRITEAEECVITENQISAEEAPDFSTACANIFMADMKDFGEIAELRCKSQELTIFNEKIDWIVLKPGSNVTINMISSSC